MKQGLWKIFSEVSSTYEVVNHVLTFGLDRIWRRQATRIAAMGRGVKWLDICSGTGQTAIYLRGSAEKEAMVVAVDFCLPMLRKAALKPGADRIIFAVADANALPFPDGTFDLVTISFATRNINVSREMLLRCLHEFRRVLRPRGRFVNLETSQPPSRLVRDLFHLYARLVVRYLGYAISRSRAGYAYLSHTILHFYSAGEFSHLLRQAGFLEIRFRQMIFGIVAIHKAVK